MTIESTNLGSTHAVENKSKKNIRLRVLGATALAFLAGIGVLEKTKPLPRNGAVDAVEDFTGLTFSEESEELVNMQNGFEQAAQSTVDNIIENGPYADIPYLTSNFAEKQWLYFLDGMPSIDVDAYDESGARLLGEFQQEVEQALEEVDQESLVERVPSIAESEDLIFMASLKDAIAQVLGDNIRYNKEYNNLFAALTPDSNGIIRLQCSSGTDLFLHQALLIAQNEEFAENMVKIYTGNQHTLPGIIVDGMLYGFEMTVRGIGFVEFGRLDDPNQSIIVLDARFALTHGIGGEIDMVAVDREYIPYPEMWDKLVNILEDELGTPDDVGARFGNGDPFTFGSAGDISSGDRNMGQSDQIPFNISLGYNGPSITTSSSSASSSRPNYGSSNNVSSGTSENGNPALDIDLSALSTEERQIVDNYMQHLDRILEFYNQHNALINRWSNNTDMSDQEFNDIQAQLDVLIEESWAYVNNNNLSQLQDDATQILEAHQLRLNTSVTRAHNTIVHNAGFMRRSR